jgi:hypothetical protein
MSTLIALGLAVSVLLVLGYIVGTELCLPCARHAVRTGDTESWQIACKLVTAGQWAILVLGASLLLLAEYNWHLFSTTPAGRLLGITAAGSVAAAVLREIAGYTRRRYARIMSTSLDLVLPARGPRRECYERLQQRLEHASPAEQRELLRALFVPPPAAGQ